MEDAATSGRLSQEELAESLLFYRRRLAGRLAVAMIRSAAGGQMRWSNPAQFAEDLANAICERLAARETGRPEGYRSYDDKQVQAPLVHCLDCGAELYMTSGGPCCAACTTKRRLRQAGSETSV